MNTDSSNNNYPQNINKPEIFTKWRKNKAEEIRNIIQKSRETVKTVKIVKTFSNFDDLADCFECKKEEEKEEEKEEVETDFCHLLKDDLDILPLLWSHPGAENMDLLLEWNEMNKLWHEEKIRITIEHTKSCEFCQVQLPKKLKRSCS